MTPEKLDIIFLLIIIIPAIMGLVRGFVKTALGFLPIPISIAGTYFIAPNICSYARGTKFYNILAEKISGAFNFEEFTGIANSAEYAERMQLPDFIKNAIMSNDNSIVQNILGTTDVNGYVSNFLANICMNVIVVIAVFLIILVICHIILSLLDMISNLPVLNFFSRVFGFIVGGIQGLAIVWIIAIILTYFVCSPENTALMELINQTYIASFLFENNVLLFLVMNVFT